MVLGGPQHICHCLHFQPLYQSLHNHNQEAHNHPSLLVIFQGKMRFWCVPSATDLESPKLPPRINRDVYLRSPPPPPRLSREEKMARGVMRDNGGARAGSDGHRVHRKKKRRKRKVPSASSSASAAVASLAAGSSGSMSDHLNQYARLPPLPEGYSSLQTRKSKGSKPAASALAAGSSATKVPLRTVAQHERSASMGELSTFKAADHRRKGKGSSAKVSAKASKNGGVGGEGDIIAELPQSGGAPNLVLHPGKSRSRERKNKLRKKGKALALYALLCGIVSRSFVARPVIGRPSHEII